MCLRCTHIKVVLVIKLMVVIKLEIDVGDFDICLLAGRSRLRQEPFEVISRDQYVQ